MSQTQGEARPLAQRLRASMDEAVEWSRGERTLRGSERVGAEWAEVEDTGPELVERLRAAGSEPADVDDAVRLVAAYNALLPEQRAQAMDFITRLSKQVVHQR